MAKTQQVGGGRGSTWSFAIWGGLAALLLAPLAAMQFTREVAWDAADFIIFGAMLAAAGLGYELAMRMSRDTTYRAAFAVALMAAFLLVWINLAVGVIGSEDNPANLMFCAVLAVGALGAFIAVFRPAGMARAMVATAIAQAVAGVITPLAGWGFIGPATVVFVALWLLSAWLFHKAARGARTGAAS